MPRVPQMPPAGYVCRRCRVPGHFIQHCPTNGDPRFDLGRSTVTPPVAGSPNDDDGIPEDLHCRICKKVMADAVMTSKCCFSSFCDRCIRAQIVGNSKCACGAHARADDLIPNPALRTTIANMRADHHYDYSAPIAPAFYDPFFGAGGTPWPADPSMYYGGMPYAYGGGYPMPMGPHHVGTVGSMEASYGYHGERHGRKRTMGCDDQRYPDRGFKTRCGGSSRSQVAVVLT